MNRASTILKWDTVTKLDVFISIVCVAVFWSFNAVVHFIKGGITPQNIILYSIIVFLLMYSLLKCYRYVLLAITPDKQWKIWHVGAISVDTALLVSAFLWFVEDDYTLTSFFSNTLSFTSLVLASCLLGVILFNKYHHKNILSEPPINLSDKVTAVYQSERILITGAAGTIGSELTKQLSRFSEVTLLLLDQSELGLQNLIIECGQSCANLIPILGDIKNKPQLEQLFSTHHPTIVFHAAAYKQLPILEQYPAEAVGTNVVGTLNLIDCAGTYQVSKVIVVSTDKAVKPTSVLGITKKITEDYTRFKLSKSEQTQWAIVRFGNVLNSNGSVITAWEQQLKSKASIEIRHPKASRYFISPNRVAHLLITLGGFNSLNRSYLFKMGDAVLLQTLAERFIETRQWKFIPTLRMYHTALLAGEKQHESLWTETETLKKTEHPLIEELVTEGPLQPFPNKQLEFLLANYLYLDNQQLKQVLNTFYTTD